MIPMLVACMVETVDGTRGALESPAMLETETLLKHPCANFGNSDGQCWCRGDSVPNKLCGQGEIFNSARAQPGCRCITASAAWRAATVRGFQAASSVWVPQKTIGITANVWLMDVPYLGPQKCRFGKSGKAEDCASAQCINPFPVNSVRRFRAPHSVWTSPWKTRSAAVWSTSSVTNFVPSTHTVMEVGAHACQCSKRPTAATGSPLPTRHATAKAAVRPSSAPPLPHPAADVCRPRELFVPMRTVGKRVFNCYFHSFSTVLFSNSENPAACYIMAHFPRWLNPVHTLTVALP